MFFVKKEAHIKSNCEWRALDEKTSKGFLSGDKEFYGSVCEESFKVVKKPPKYVRNSFLPIILGKFEYTEESNPTIHIKCRLHHFISLFMLLTSIVTVILPFFLGLIMLGPDTVNGCIFLAASLGMGVFNALLLVIGFYIPADKAIKRLREIFEEKVEE